LIDDPVDVICFQETQAFSHEVDLSNEDYLSRYHWFWNPAEKPGYSGVAAAIKTMPDSVRNSIVGKEIDREGRLLVTGLSNIQILNAYIPNGGRDLYRLDY
jgi:exodeoxyribonuclease-3